MKPVRLAVRNLLRSRWRSGLAAGGIAVATAVLIWNLGMLDGFFEAMVRGTTDVDIGHVQVQDTRYVDQPATIDYFEWDDDVREAIEGTAGVEATTPRVRLFGLVGHQDRSHIGRILGVDPAGEPEVTVMADGIVEGRWLDEQMPEAPPAEVVVGRGLSRALDVGVGDELVVIAEGADGSMGDGLLEIVGILETGNSRIDRQAAVLHIEEAQFIAAVDDGVHEAISSVNRPADAREIAGRMGSRLDQRGYDGLEARGWQDVEPELYQMLLYGNAANQVIFAIVFFVVALGVLNALRMSARERHREFGVMMAVGLSRVRLFSMLIVEGLILGVAGAAVGGLIGGAVTWVHATRGLDFGMFVEGEATWMGVSFADRIYFVMTPETVLIPVVGLIVVSVICGLWPAVSSTRLDPRDAITGRT